MQTLLVVIFSLLSLPWALSQTPNPIQVTLRSSGSSYTDQFPAAAPAYTYGIVESVSPQLGSEQFILGTESNTLKVVFTPTVGATGTTDLIVHYYTLSAPMHPVTRAYRFTIAPEIVVTGDDNFIVDKNGVNIPFPVLVNDSASLGSFAITSLSVTNSGSASVNTTGDTIYFTPETDFEGDAWLQYIACDSAGNCSQGQVHVLVRDPNLQDQLSFKKYLLNREQLELLTPFPDFTVENDPSHGTLESSGASSWVYTPEVDFTGKDTIKLGLSGLVTREYIITVYDKVYNVQAIDDKFYVRPGLSVTFNVLNNDLLDFDLVSNTNPSKGTINNQGNGVYTYSPNNNFRGVDKFTYTTCYQDTVYCETATVLLHVTDLEPESTFTYALQTSEGLPLVIDHPVEFTDFSYIISDAPEHGNFVYYDGVQTINLPCDTIEGYNVLVYEPEAGYTGTDHFEYYFCIQPTNICYQVKVDMNVIADQESENCPCVIGCVWPGDADQDGRVDMNDLLTIGYQLGETGPERTYNAPGEWFGQHPATWGYNDNGARAEYLDANGDGSITEFDVQSIDDYYYRSHDIVVKDVQQKLPYQFSLVPVQFSLDSGDVVILDVALGNANVPVIDLKGTKFSVNIPPAWLDSASVQVLFHQDSWLSEGSPSISLGKVPWDGRIDAGYSKTLGNGSSGFGVIATIVFIIEDDAEGFKKKDGSIQIPISLHSASAMDNSGTTYDIDGDEVYLTLDPKTIQKDYELIVYPNPAQDMVNIHLNGKTTIESITVVDPQGRIIRNYDDINLKQHQVDVSNLPVGLYYLQVNHTHGVMTQMLSVIR